MKFEKIGHALQNVGYFHRILQLFKYKTFHFHIDT